MLIGIDESGTFQVDSNRIHVFAAIHICENQQLESLDVLLRDWKDEHRSLKNQNGEIKGSALTEKLAVDFFRKVLWPIGSYFVSYCAVRPSVNSPEDYESIRRKHLIQMDAGINFYKNRDKDKAKSRITQDWISMRNWYSNLPLQLILKMLTLGNFIPDSYSQHVLAVTVKDLDETLGQLSVLADKDFIRARQHVAIWKHFLSFSFYAFHMRQPLLLPEDWPKSHPFYRATGLGSGHTVKLEDGCTLTEGRRGFIEELFDFEESHKSSLLQIADIIANVLNKKFNSNTYDDAFRQFKPAIIPIQHQELIITRQLTRDEQERVPKLPSMFEILPNTPQD